MCCLTRNSAECCYLDQICIMLKITNYFIAILWFGDLAEIVCVVRLAFKDYVKLIPVQYFGFKVPTIIPRSVQMETMTAHFYTRAQTQTESRSMTEG